MRQEGSGQRASVRVTDKERLPDETSGLYAELAEEQVFLSHDERKKKHAKGTQNVSDACIRTPNSRPTLDLESTVAAEPRERSWILYAREREIVEVYARVRR
jgi:hypothetical protein